MIFIGAVPRRSVNLPPGSLRTLFHCIHRNEVQEGPAIERFAKEFGKWLGAPHVFGASSGRTAFHLALEALDLEKGAEIIFPAFTFPVMPMVAKLLGYTPVFCDVDPETFNSGPEHIGQKITGRTGAVLATHLFGRPCPIEKVAELARERNIRLIEDCAHACGVRVGGKQVGTFGDAGVFSFAEGKNMPCFGGGAVATADKDIASRAKRILANSPVPPKGTIIKNATSIWIQWLLTRPLIFGVTAYPVLRLKGTLGQPLMDSVVGDELLDQFSSRESRITGLSNLQAAVGLLQIQQIDSFNEGARRNAGVLTENLGEIEGIGVPRTTEGNHIYVYYPLRIDRAERRDNLRHHLLKHRIDSKTTDMADCSTLKAFRDTDEMTNKTDRPGAASILEICVYPVIPQSEMQRIARIIKTWAGQEEE